MNLLHRRILAELLWVLAGGTVGALGVLTLLGILRLVQGGLGVAQAASLVSLGAPALVGYALPLATLGAVTAVAARLASDREWQAAQWGGIRPLSLSAPFWFAGVAASLLSLPQHLSWIPASRRAVDRGEGIARSQAPFRAIEGGERSLPPLALGGGRQMRIWFDRLEEGRLHDAVFFVTDDEACTLILRAREVDIRFEASGEADGAGEGADAGQLVLVPRDGTATSIARDGRPGHPATFREGEPLSVPIARRAQGKDDPRSLSWHRLLRSLEGEDGREVTFTRAALLCSASARIADGLAPIAFVAIGLPLGIALAHPNRLVPFGAALAVVFGVYYPVQMGAQAVGTVGQAAVAVAAPWAAPALLAALGVWGWRRVAGGARS